jgi:hypothetical protein
MADDFSKSLGVNVKANFDPSGFEKGSDRVIASAERQGTALQALRRSTQELQQLQSAYAKTPEIYAAQREIYRQGGGRGASIFSKEAEKLELSRIGYQIKMAGGLPPDTDIGAPEEELEAREISTRRLSKLVEDKFSQFGGMSKTQRKALLGDIQPHVGELRRRYGATQNYYAEKVRETTAEFEGLSGEDQLKNLDAFNQKIQQFEENGRKARIASDELAKSTKNFTEQAGLASKSLPSYAASVINMGVTIGQGIAQITRAGALAFDYSSPMAMYSAQQQFEIQKSKTMWSTGGSIIGQVAGLGVGMATGFNPFMSSYIGGMLGGGAGDIIGTFLNIDPEKQLKFMGQMYGKSSEMANQVAGIQSTEYGIARRTGTSPEEIRALLKKYGASGLNQSATGQLYSQFVNTTGIRDKKTFDDWMQMYLRTGVTPSGMFEKLTGQNSVDMIVNAGMAMGLGANNKARFADVSQMMQYSTNIAGKLFTNPIDIERATSMTTMLPYTLYGENLKGNNWATSFEGMQQVAQGFQALGQPKNTAQQAFLFNALNKGGNWRETFLRMQEGIEGKGNLQDILGYAKKAYGGRAGDAIFSMLSEKGISPGIIRDIVRQFEGDYTGMMSRLGENPLTGKEAFKKLGVQINAPLDIIKAREAISVTESARGMAESFTKGLADFNIKVAELAGSPDTQKKIQEMYGKVISSVEEAFLGATTHMDPESQARKNYIKKHPEDPFGFHDTPLAPDWVNKSSDQVSISMPGGKRMILNVHTTISAANTVPTSNTTSVTPR